jgi:phenylalanyl-tRNA synthetase alpha chain
VETTLQPELQGHFETAQARIAAATCAEELRAVDRDYLDKGGVVAGLLAAIPTLPPEQRRGAGQGANQLKTAVLGAIDVRKAELEADAIQAARSGKGFDPTLPGTPMRRGSLHPVTRVTRELEDIFSSMGYGILDGPEVEIDAFNFERLNIPSDHPARDMHDTFWCKVDGAERDSDMGLLLRTHTSCVQVRAMEKLKPPFRVVVPGRVFRQESVDASHEHTFHQMEGLVVGEGLTVGHLIGTMKTFLREVFQKEIEVRLRPGYFPFVEPGFELDARCPFCETVGAGCKVCKQTSWVELCPCGMVHPSVLKLSGIDPEKYTGFAFGLGLSRLVMLRYEIDDIRHLMGGDTRFLSQF